MKIFDATILLILALALSAFSLVLLLDHQQQTIQISDLQQKCRLQKDLILLQQQQIEECRSSLTLENVYQELINQNVAFPNIVMKQIILETGHLSSKTCLNNNNLFGIRIKDDLFGRPKYKFFTSWQQSVTFYKEKIQSKYHGQLNNNEGYYQFLNNLPYAEDSNYVKVLKRVQWQE